MSGARSLPDREAEQPRFSLRLFLPGEGGKKKRASWARAADRGRETGGARSAIVLSSCRRYDRALSVSSSVGLYRVNLREEHIRAQLAGNCYRSHTAAATVLVTVVVVAVAVVIVIIGAFICGPLTPEDARAGERVREAVRASNAPVNARRNEMREEESH